MHVEFYSIDMPAMIIAALAGFCCSLIGNVLLFQKRAMLTDTLSHSIFPGLVLAYIITGTLASIALFIGALATCVIAAIIVHLIQKKSVLDSGIAMGITLTTMFAGGIIMLETFISGRVHLDTEHALYGSLELTYWPRPHNFETLPEQIKVLGLLALILISFTIFGFKSLKLRLFDPVYAKNIGTRGRLQDILILILTVCVAVACFEAVGVILVLALFICPPATARMLTDSLKDQMILSVFIGIFCGVSGYALGALAPLWLGFENSMNAAGSIAITAGIVQSLAMLFAPQYGYIAGMQRKLSQSQKQLT